MFTKTFRPIANLVFGLSFLLATGSVTAAGAASPAFGFYLGYLEQTATADGMEDIGDFMPEWWIERQRSASATDQAAAVERIKKSSAALKQVSLEREEPADGGVRLHMTARSDDLPMHGSVLLVKESGAFKVEESVWRSVAPIVN